MGTTRVEQAKVSVPTFLASSDGEASTSVYEFKVPPGTAMAIIQMRTGDFYKLGSFWQGWSQSRSEQLLVPIEKGMRSILHTRADAVDFLPKGATLRGVDAATVVEAAVTTAGTAGATAAPTLATEGVELAGARALMVTAYAPLGETISVDTGELLNWYYDPDLAIWVRRPSLDIPVSVSGVRGFAHSDRTVEVPKGRSYYQASGVTPSSGNITVGIRRVA